MMPIELYSLNFTPTTGEYIIQKFDTDYSCESVYALTLTSCMCPQGHKDSCRHRKMLGDFLKHGHIGDGWFLEWQTRLWRRPVGESGEFVDELAKGTNTNPQLDAALKFFLPEDQVSRPSVGEERHLHPSPLPGDEVDAPSPPPPPEGPTSLSHGAATISPVGIVAPIVKRRKV